MNSESWLCGVEYKEESRDGKQSLICNQVFKTLNQLLKNIFKDIKETMPKELQKSMRTMSLQIQNINKVEIIKRNQRDILKLKSTIMKMKNSLEDPNSIFEQAEERLSELEDRAIEIIWYEEHKEKRMKKIEQSLKTCETS